MVLSVGCARAIRNVEYEALGKLFEGRLASEAAARLTLVNNISPLDVSVKRNFGVRGGRIKIRHSDLNGAVFPNLVTALNELYVGVFYGAPGVIRTPGLLVRSQTL